MKRNADGGKVRRLSFTLEQPVGRDMERPLADLLDEAVQVLGLLGAGEPGTPRKKRWLAKWAIRIVCEALLRQGEVLPLPWGATVYAAGGHQQCEAERERSVAINDAYHALKGGA